MIPLDVRHVMKNSLNLNLIYYQYHSQFLQNYFVFIQLTMVFCHYNYLQLRFSLQCTVSCFSLFVSQSVPLVVSHSLYFVATFGVFVFTFCTQKCLYNRPYKSYHCRKELRGREISYYLIISVSSGENLQKKWEINRNYMCYLHILYRKANFLGIRFYIQKNFILPARSCITV